MEHLMCPEDLDRVADALKTIGVSVERDKESVIVLWSFRFLGGSNEKQTNRIGLDEDNCLRVLDALNANPEDLPPLLILKEGPNIGGHFRMIDVDAYVYQIARRRLEGSL